ncbi:HNH endonuclease signature motif containing protein [Spirosoma agri]|uniref:HNH endonuclease n=1 Tax=Spirosoma agri TaxID=1987381 RepID=A0A6M0IG20_9BACT|nr:HNH endonuclease signature motif containing protein [Spirosoma agri]NEU66301.1 HNH endonuclease [Spirosoma agri]
MATKKERELIVAKYGGRCAYCGCELVKGWHVDEVKPIRCKKKWDPIKRKWIHDGTCRYPKRLHIDNQNPSCASCNINKHAMSLEDFRKLIGGFLTSLNRDSTQYRIAKRYGLVVENEKPVLFYFETVEL